MSDRAGQAPGPPGFPLPGNSEMTARIGAFDWAGTLLGPTDRWPVELRSAVRLILASPRPMQILWGPGQVQIFNDAFATTMGLLQQPALGTNGNAYWETAWQQVGSQVERVWRGEGPVWLDRAMVPVTRHGHRADAWWNYSCSAIHTDHGIGGILVICEEVTERVQAELRGHLLMQEMNHRVKNTLATVQSLMMLTSSTAKSLDHFTESLGERIAAMARAQDILLRGHDGDVAVGDLMNAEFAPYASSDQLQMDCAPLQISARHAVSVGLILHELLTNAAKYGALSSPGGLLQVRCVPEADRGVIHWREHAEHPIAVKRGRGFGTVLIEQLARELGGEARFDLQPTGLEAKVSFCAATAPGA